MKRRNAWIGMIVVMLGYAAVALYGRGRDDGAAQGKERETEVSIPGDAVAVRILLGRLDKEPASWDGGLRLSEGTVLQLHGWNFRQGDSLTGETTWKATSRRAPLRPAQRPNNATGPMMPKGVTAVLATTSASVVTVTTPRGEFQFNPARIAAGSPALFLNGAAAVERVLPDFQVTSGATEDDFPAAARLADGSLLVAYVAYQYGKPERRYATPLTQPPLNFEEFRPKGNGDQVRLARVMFQNGRGLWQPVADLTPPGQDVYRPAIAADSDGNAWVVWSQNVQGNWDLYARYYGNGRLSDTVRLTSDPGPDLHASLACDDLGTFWLAWQGFRKGQADIFLMSARQNVERWSAPTLVSASAHNDWDPQVACAHDGSVYIAWDTYDHGSYDVLLRRMQNGSLSPIVPVANSPRFEARPSLVCDGQSRAWVAWEEGPAHWGKDFGYINQTTTANAPLYRGHTVAVCCFQDLKPYRTAGDLKSGLPAAANLQASFPRLGIDAAGRVYLTYRRPHPELLIQRAGTSWLSYFTICQGDRWSAPMLLPLSDGLLDSRPALVPAGPEGILYIVHASDGRSHLFGQDPQFHLYVAPIGVSGTGSGPPSLAPQSTPHDAVTDPDTVRERADVARMRASRLRVAGRQYLLLRGDWHRHTEISSDGGGDGPLIDMFRYALDAADLDWICAGDHAYGNGREYTWWLIQKLDDAFHAGAWFVPLFGEERSIRYPFGHRNVMFAQRGIRSLPMLRGELPNQTDPRDTEMLYRYLEEFDGVCASHTSATDMGTNWSDNSPRREPVVEIYQGIRQNYEYPGAPRSNSENDSLGGWRPDGFVSLALARGYRLGFQASSDHVSTHMSYAFALAESPTREGILDAFKKRHAYGATDNILLDVRSGSHLMGDEFVTEEVPSLQMHVVGTGPIARIVVVRDNKVVYTATPGMQRADINWTDGDARPGVSYYYVRVEQKDGQLAWASPFWIHYRSRTGR